MTSCFAESAIILKLPCRTKEKQEQTRPRMYLGSEDYKSAVAKRTLQLNPPVAPGNQVHVDLWCQKAP